MYIIMCVWGGGYACLYTYMHIDVDQVIQTVFPIDTQCNTTLCVVDIIMNTAMVTLKQHYFTWTMYNVYVHMQENTPPPPHTKYVYCLPYQHHWDP